MSSEERPQEGRARPPRHHPVPPNAESAAGKTEDDDTRVHWGAKASQHQLRQAAKELCDTDVAKVNTPVRPDGQKKASVRWLLTVTLWMWPTKLVIETESGALCACWSPEEAWTSSGPCGILPRVTVAVAWPRGDAL